MGRRRVGSLSMKLVVCYDLYSCMVGDIPCKQCWSSKL